MNDRIGMNDMATTKNLFAFAALLCSGAGLLSCSGDPHSNASPMSGMMSGNPPSAATQPLPEPTSAGAQLLQQKCGGCHAPPHPNTHTSMEWVGVVGRMQNYRVVRGHGAIAQPEQQRLLEYLQAYSRSLPARGS